MHLDTRLSIVTPQHLHDKYRRLTSIYDSSEIFWSKRALYLPNSIMLWQWQCILLDELIYVHHKNSLLIFFTSHPWVRTVTFPNHQEISIIDQLKCWTDYGVSAKTNVNFWVYFLIRNVVTLILHKEDVYVYSFKF